MSEEPTGNGNRLVETRDGSHTVYSSQFDQHYHNPNGAVAESRYVFFEQTGLLDRLASANQITIFEVGFGTGLNLMLLMDYYLSEDSQAKITYFSVEGFPLQPDTVTNFNFTNHLTHPEAQHAVTDFFSQIKKGNNQFQIADRISVHLFNGLFEDIDCKKQEVQANYIFHDAFSPDVNGELWTGETFKKLRAYSADDVILSTYCAASKAQGALAWAGWKVGKTRGALGKREMILAALDSHQLEGCKQVNEERYARRYEQGDFD
ncbi:tRNA (5-methylaminomethyl-2-thiouridine)(34)-methyltransferase MnmD [Fodinibius salsisoli]|uniref:tRNA (5-methylaminomethyl-2-thiouridine)(34)-methyltransferase MnmD n=1 Tax=Fodinibius salsisoli TaxID=2820877 RepID=A0ABT3PP19_9BACT|nr:tRNA (5-methylaminomethyl-2-thiouridine)(34)-methyltransferase MnmD [Fodinibius salsisoli]MCW9707604.1 tRNA (5-methylaminomethyl-2-thiouridine)(34)-methyltransferase MnmD [Fodinibius salsisoli]